MIICGGMHSEFGEYSKDIYIWNLRSGEFTMSDMQCPVRARLRASCMEDFSIHMIISGLMRKVYGRYLHLVLEMVHWIAQWVGTESVYLVAYLTGKTWKIRVHDLLAN